MRAPLSIGDFRRMTYPSVEALRHYHDLGVLVPAEVDRRRDTRTTSPRRHRSRR